MMTAEYTFDDELISDLHKDAMGYRPGEYFWEFWSKATDAEKQAEWDSLLNEMDRRNKLQEEEEKACIAKFEQHVTNTICMGAGDRETALRWIMDASDCQGDWEYLAYNHGLPYFYFKNKVQNA